MNAVTVLSFPQRRGRYPPPPGESDIMGLEVAGTVAALGPGLKRGWEPDDRVMALLCGGGYAEYVAVPEELLMPVPPDLTLCQAAAIPEVWLTAFQLLAVIGTQTITHIQSKVVVKVDGTLITTWCLLLRCSPLFSVALLVLIYKNMATVRL